MTGIYNIVSPDGEIYVGHTYDLVDRIRTHRYQQGKRKSVLYESFLKHGFDSHKIFILHELPKDIDRNTMTVYEQFYIDQHIEAGTILLNQCTKAQYGFRKGYTPWNKGKKNN